MPWLTNSDNNESTISKKSFHPDDWDTDLIRLVKAQAMMRGFLIRKKYQK